VGILRGEPVRIGKTRSGFGVEMKGVGRGKEGRLKYRKIKSRGFSQRDSRGVNYNHLLTQQQRK